MSEGNHSNGNLTRFKWLVVAGMIALILVIGFIQNLID